MNLTKLTSCRRASFDLLPLGLLILALTLLVPVSVQGAAFETGTFGAGPRGDGFGTVRLPTSNVAATNAAANDVLRWENAAVLGTQTITYGFTPAFLAHYGLAGEGKVTTAFTSWQNKVTFAGLTGGDISTPFGGTDIALQGFAGSQYDLQSVALHEIGHVLGLDHPDVASAINPNTTADNSGGNLPTPAAGDHINYNVDPNADGLGLSDWVKADLLGSQHPVMWSLIASGVDRQSLTYDDIYGVQYLYSPTAGRVAAPALGPSMGNGTPFNFSLVANNPQVLIDAGFLPATTLASTGVTTAAKGGGAAYYVASAASITFAIPEPASLVLFALGAIGLLAVARRRRAA